MILIYYYYPSFHSELYNYFRLCLQYEQNK